MKEQDKMECVREYNYGKVSFLLMHTHTNTHSHTLTNTHTLTHITRTLKGQEA